MTKRSEHKFAVVERSATDAAAQLARANKHGLELMFGAQKTMFEEMMFAGNEMIERTRTEMHLFTEFVSKLAEAHSVKNLETMAEECARHQIDFIRRDSARLFKHGERMIEVTSNLLANRPGS